MAFKLKSQLVVINSVIVLTILVFSSLFTMKIYQDSFNAVSDRVNSEIDKTLEEKTTKAAEITNNIIFDTLSELSSDVKTIADTEVLNNLLEYDIIAKGELEKTDNGYIQRYRRTRPFIDFQLIAGKLKNDYYYSQNASIHIDLYDDNGDFLGATVGMPGYLLESDTAKVKNMLKSYVGYIDIMDIVSSNEGLSLKVYQKIAETHGLVGLSMPLDLDFLQKIKNITDTEVVLFKGADFVEGTIFEFGKTINPYKMDPEQKIFSELQINKQIIITGSTTYPDKILDLGIIEDKRKLEKFRFAFLPLLDFSGHVVGMIGIGISASNIEQALEAFQMERDKTNTRIIKTFLIISIIALLIGISLIYSYATHGITRPLQQIIKVFSASANGDYSARIHTKRKDELGELANYFNNFMSEIEDSHKQLSVSENRFRALFEKTADARFIMEGEHVTACNEAVVNMFRYKSKDDILNMRPSDLSPEFQPDGRRSAEKAEEMIRLAHEKGSHRFLWDHIRSDGEIFPVDIELTVIPYKDRKLLHVLARDISRQKAVEQQLIQAQKMETVGTLAGGIAHDFNNILSAIFGYNELAAMHVDNKEKLQDDLGEVRKAGERAKSLVQQILTFSRKSEQIKHPLQIAIIVKEVTKLLRSSLPSTIEIRQQIHAKEQTVLADPTQIHQILMNLCTNAHHAMRETGGILGILLQEKIIGENDQILGEELSPGRYLEMEVSDTGMGMNTITKNKIFEPYFTTKETGEGTGLGLAVVHGIVQDYQGTIHVYSEPGQGTTFRIYLPIVEETARVEKEQKTTIIAESNGGHILFVDDEEKILAIAREVFLAYGYKITTHSKPEEALASFKQNPDAYDLLITDMTMPQMTGVELARKVMDLKPDFPVVLCTGYSELINKESALELGIKEFISKPVVMSKMVTVIKKILQNVELS